MRTLKEVTDRISEILRTPIKDPQPLIEEKLKQKARKELPQLKMRKYYLETNPSEQYLKDSLASCELRLDVIIDNFDEWLRHRPKDGKLINELKAEYNKENETAKIKMQIKELKYLLKK